MNHRRIGRKALQLAAQIRQTLEFILADVGEPVLADVMVDSVEPAGGPGHFVVAVTGSADPDEVLAALGRVAPRLREEVADDVHRRRAPNLVFRYLLDESASDS